MKKAKAAGIFFFSMAGFLSGLQVFAEELLLTGHLETGYYQAEETLIAQRGARVVRGRQVWMLAGDQIILQAGFRVENGASLSAVIGGFSAVPPHLDLDEDGLPDMWELQYFGHLALGPANDFDADGFSNFTEYNLGSNPLIFGDMPSGLSFRYDALGRVVEITRVPLK
jgi:hypothetical protein